MQREFEDAVFEFIKSSSRVGRLKAIFLFGSVAKGEAKPDSDIDFLVVFNSGKKPSELKEKKIIGDIALDIEKKYNRNVQVVFSNRIFDGIDRGLIEDVFRDGILLFGGIPEVDTKRLKLVSHSLIYYSMKNIPPSKKMMVKRALYGYKTIKRVGAKTYTNVVKGLVDQFGGEKTGRGALVVPSKNSRIIADALKRFGVNYKKLDIWLSQV